MTLHIKCMVKLTRRRAIAILGILNTISAANLAFQNYTIRAIQTLFPALSTQILSAIVGMVSITLSAPSIYFVYRLSRGPELSRKKQLP